jgi:EAL and modified HD-GYP domain-containing signal transduction protein
MSPKTYERRRPPTLPSAKICAEDVYLGRQPIYSVDRKIQAYELLYRGARTSQNAAVSHPDRASAEVLLEAFVEIGLPRVSPDQPVFVNHTKDLLMVDPIIPADRCVVEVLEDVRVDPDTVAAVERLKRAGYRIALDDFTYSEEYIPLLRIADFVKFDVRAVPSCEARRHVSIVKRYGVQIIAEKIESEPELRAWAALGCDLFQGYYLRRPEVLDGRRLPANRLSALSLIAACRQEDGSLDRISNVIARDAALTYGLLHLANSALYRRNAEIQTPNQAVRMLGLDCILRWASLLVLAGHDNCPTGYLEFALQRARMCELVARGAGCTEPHAAYIAGLLSALDAIFDMPLPAIIEPLPLDKNIKSALLERSGELGSVLAATLTYEHGSPDSGIRSDVLSKAFWDAVEYASSMLADIPGRQEHAKSGQAPVS